MIIYYGLNENIIDITSICFNKLFNNNIITIPAMDHNRSFYFSDPLFGVLKKIYIIINNIVSSYEYNCVIKINMLDNTITTINTTYNKIDEKLKLIQSKLNINYGSFDEEYPEQKMSVKYLTGSEKVLEIGGNIGRNSLIIASILENKNNLVTLETDVKIYNQLIENRDLNNLTFNIENSALSNRKLIQRGWDTIPSDILIDGYEYVNTISLNDLNKKYNIEFDTLVLDCEGAFYYILMDIPELLNNIKLIIMENDYNDISHKEYINNILIENKFYREYSKRGGWGPCFANFFEVWKKL